MGKGKRYEGESRLNLKKVLGLCIAILVIIMFVVSLQKLLTGEGYKTEKNKVAAYYSVYTNNKWGVIDNNGDTVIEPTYDEMVVVPNKEKPVFICTYDMDVNNRTYKTKVLNEKNETIMGDYDKVELLDNYDKNNNIWYEKNILKIQKNGLYGIVNFDGKIILNPEYENIKTLKGVSNAVIIIKNGKMGICNGLGEIIIKPEYKNILPLGNAGENGYIVVNESDKFGIIGNNKKVIVEPKYEDIKSVASNDFYVVKEAGKWKIIDILGDTVVAEGFEDVTAINNENIIVTNKGKYLIINNEAKKVFDAEYDYLEYAFDTYYIAKKDNKYGMINLQNETKIEFKYTNMIYRKDADLLEAENQNLETEIYNKNLELQITGIVSEINISDGYIRIRVGDDYKYYNFKFEEKKNNEILKGKTLYLSKKDGKYGYTDKNGNVIVEHIYDDAKEQNEYGFSAIKLNDVWGAVDKTGKVIVEPKYTLKDNILINFIGKWHIGKDLNMNYYTDTKE